MTVNDALRVNLVILIGFLPNFIYGLLSSNSCSGLNTFFTLSNDKQEGRKNGCRLSVSRTGHSN